MMQKKFLQIGAFLIIIAFVSGFATNVSAVGNPQPLEANGIVSVQTNLGNISVTGGDNVPFFHIKLNGTPNNAYQVNFLSMQEFVDKNNDGLFQTNEIVPNSNSPFPGIGWAFSGFNLVNDSNNNLQMVNFNFSHDVAPMLAISNHVNVTAGNQIKFDLALNQYTWKSNNNSAKLAISLKVAGGVLSKDNSKNDLTFGNAFFNTVDTADSNGNTISVTTQIGTGSTFYLIFDHFDGNFTLDPLFGVNSVSSTSTNSATSTSSGSSSSSSTVGSSSSKTAALDIFPVLGSIAVLGLVIKQKRKHI